MYVHRRQKEKKKKEKFGETIEGDMSSRERD
jgi:hypothetical protein